MPGARHRSRRRAGRTRSGDDVRRIDWNLTARTTVPHVRDTIADRELETWIVVDRSASLDFGTAQCEKRDLALAVVAAVGLPHRRSGNRVGALVLGDDRHLLRPPARAGREAMFALLHQVDGVRAPDVARPRPATCAALLRTVAKLARRRGLVVVVSDFLDQLRLAAALCVRCRVRHDVLAVEILDPARSSFPPVGLVTLVDTETGRRIEVQTASEKVRARFAEAAAHQRAAIASDVRGAAPSTSCCAPTATGSSISPSTWSPEAAPRHTGGAHDELPRRIPAPAAPASSSASRWRTCIVQRAAPQVRGALHQRRPARVGGADAAGVAAPPRGRVPAVALVLVVLAFARPAARSRCRARPPP